MQSKLCQNIHLMRVFFNINVIYFRRAFSSSESNFISSVHELINLQIHPVNMAHLAELIKEQLLSTCIQEAFQQSNLLAKVSSLNNRLDRSLDNSVMERDFPGTQLFFKSVIEAAFTCNGTFLRYLQVSIAQTVMEANGTVIAIEEDDHSQVERFADLVLKLRIAAKFLGLIDALPFKCQQEQLSEEMLSQQIKMREMVTF